MLYLEIELSSFDTFCLILKSKQMSPSGFGGELQKTQAAK